MQRRLQNFIKMEGCNGRGLSMKKSLYIRAFLYSFLLSVVIMFLLQIFSPRLGIDYEIVINDLFTLEASQAGIKIRISIWLPFLIGLFAVVLQYLESKEFKTIYTNILKSQYFVNLGTILKYAFYGVIGTFSLAMVLVGLILFLGKTNINFNIPYLLELRLVDTEFEHSLFIKPIIALWMGLIGLVYGVYKVWRKK